MHTRHQSFFWLYIHLRSNFRVLWLSDQLKLCLSFWSYQSVFGVLIVNRYPVARPFADQWSSLGALFLMIRPGQRWWRVLWHSAAKQESDGRPQVLSTLFLLSRRLSRFRFVTKSHSRHCTFVGGKNFDVTSAAFEELVDKVTKLIPEIFFTYKQ